jgi:hypothetical protein
MRSFLIFLGLVFLVGAFPGKVQSLEVVPREEISIDLSIIQEDKSFSTPTKILIVPIVESSGLKNITAEKWIKGIYYYTVDVLGFSDVPFHYLISSDGTVYEGNQGGDERKIFIDGVGGDSIVIGYLSSNSETRFTTLAESSLRELVLQVANANSIRPENNVSVSDIVFKKNAETSSVSIATVQTFGNWKKNLDSIVSSIKNDYRPVAKEYKAEVLEVSVPSEEVNPGDTITAKVKIKNTGTRGMYAGSDSEIILSKKTSGTSDFYINNYWLSQTQLPAMKEGQTLLPAGEETYELQIRAPLFFGERSEQFELKTLGGSSIAANSFDIKLKMKKSDKRIVEIKNSEVGFVNIRNNPNTSAEVLIKAVAGQRYFILEENTQTLWAKLDLGDGRSGWVALWYLNSV